MSEINELSKKEKILNSIKNLKTKKNNIFFVVGTAEVPNASTYEIYRHAISMKNEGYNITMLTDTDSYIIPEWIESELTELKHESIEKTRISINPEDVMIIPEVFSNVMEQTKDLPCLRIGLLQSIDYMLNSLVPGTDWSTFGINNIITTSDNLKNIVDEFYNKKFNINILKPIIPDYFFNNKKLKKPIISIVGRNSNEVAKVVKLFYSKFPQFTWITFDSMYTESNPPQPLKRKDYAERLQNNIAAVWIDKLASFGTFPLECMASGTIPVGLTPYIIPEYLVNNEKEESIKENIGYWSSNIYDIPLLLNRVITESLDDVISDEYLDKMNNIALDYKASNNTDEVKNLYNKLLTERLTIFENALKNIEINENNNDIKNDKDE